MLFLYPYLEELAAYDAFSSFMYEKHWSDPAWVATGVTSLKLAVLTCPSDGLGPNPGKTSREPNQLVLDQIQLLWHLQWQELG